MDCLPTFILKTPSLQRKQKKRKTEHSRLPSDSSIFLYSGEVVKENHGTTIPVPDFSVNVTAGCFSATAAQEDVAPVPWIL